MKPLTFHPKVPAEIDDAVDYYESREKGLGSRLRELIAIALERIRENPQCGVATSFNLQLFRIRRFPYGILFKNRDEAIHVFALYHLSRRPGYWADRLEELN